MCVSNRTPTRVDAACTKMIERNKSGDAYLMESQMAKLEDAVLAFDLRGQVDDLTVDRDDLSDQVLLVVLAGVGARRGKGAVELVCKRDKSGVNEPASRRSRGRESLTFTPHSDAFLFTRRKKISIKGS